jgi:Fe-S-cluster-containing dehydrogenase component
VATRLAISDSERCVGCQCCMFACARRFGEGGLAKTCISIRSVGGMERGFVVLVCRACADPPCAKVCPANALTERKGGGVTLDTSKCLGCRLCETACLIGSVFWDEGANKPMICSHCGVCVGYCPHQVLKSEET